MVTIHPSFRRSLAVLLLGGCDSPPSLTDDNSSFHFVNVATQVGVDAPLYSGGREKRFIVEAKGGSAGAFFDHDEDGDLDLYVVNGSQLDTSAGTTPRTNILYRNNLSDEAEASFTDISVAAGVDDQGWGMGVTTADYDNDGDQDIYVTNHGANAFYRNEADGSYLETAAAAGVADTSWSTGCSFADYDRDGDLDLYVSNYVDFRPVLEWHPAGQKTRWHGLEVFVGPAGLEGLPNVLYQNQGDGHFVDVTQAAGMADPGRPSLAAVWGDYDNDGDPDLYVANDSAPNYLYRNAGDGTFLEVAAVAGVATDRDGRPQAGMGCAFEDFDNDGWLDLFVTNFASDSSTLYRNNASTEGRSASTAGLYYTDVTYALGLGAATWAPLSWGTGFADFDHDGDKDLFVANGHVYPVVDEARAGSYAQHNQLFENTLFESGREDFNPIADFNPVAAGPGLLVRKVSRGATFGDYDGDGDIDIFVADLDDEPTLLRNDTPAKGHFLIIKTVGVTSNRDGVGTRIVVKAGSSTQIREIRAGDGFLTRSDARAHFGLGPHAHADIVELHWPSGQVDRIADVAADRVVIVEEGVGLSSVPVRGLQ